RDELFSRSAFAVNQNAAVGRSSDADLLAQRFHGNAVANHLITMAELAAKRLIFFLEASLLHGVAHEDDDAFERKRLFDKVERAEFCRAHSRFDAAVTGNHDDRRWMRNGLHAAECFKAVHTGKPDVEKDDFEIASRGAFERFFGRFGGLDVIALVRKNRRE